ncbi:hypothetical protein NEIRO03_2119 [Nematocida sp. AWRm78]|nr:hypothetical protein NEIRO03_2119 [Nematocida sp. AWRm78]
MFLQCVCLLLSVLVSYIAVAACSLYKLIIIQINTKKRYMSERVSLIKSEEIVVSVLLHTGIFILFIVGVKYYAVHPEITPNDYICAYLGIRNILEEYKQREVQIILNDLLENAFIYSIYCVKNAHSYFNRALDIFISVYLVSNQFIPISSYFSAFNLQKYHKTILNQRKFIVICINACVYLIKRIILHILMRKNSIFLNYVFMTENNSKKSINYISVSIILIQALHIRKILEYMI